MKQVYELCGAGPSIRGIAERLGLSPNAVQVSAGAGSAGREAAAAAPVEEE